MARSRHTNPVGLNAGGEVWAGPDTMEFSGAAPGGDQRFGGRDVTTRCLDERPMGGFSVQNRAEARVCGTMRRCRSGSRQWGAVAWLAHAQSAALLIVPGSAHGPLACLG